MICLREFCCVSRNMRGRKNTLEANTYEVCVVKGVSILKALTRANKPKNAKSSFWREHNFSHLEPIHKGRCSTCTLRVTAQYARAGWREAKNETTLNHHFDDTRDDSQRQKRKQETQGAGFLIKMQPKTSFNLTLNKEKHISKKEETNASLAH